MEFTLYFSDADDAFAAQRRVEQIGQPVETLADVRTDLIDYLEQIGSTKDPITVAREHQKLLDPVTVAWPASGEGEDWELVLKADSIDDVQGAVGIDLDWSWEESA